MLNVEAIDLYYGAAQALRGVSLKAAVGKVTCVLGRNGVGKSSLLRAIVGQQPIRSGRIMWGEEDISRLAPQNRARKGVAYVPQGREIFPLLTVKENLETGYAAAPRGERFTPDEIFDLFPVLASMMSRRGGDLSGGQQQQLAIGRVMISSPQLVLLDEPSEGIQPSIVQDIARTMMEINRSTGVTIVFVEQNLDMIRTMAQRCYVMDKGRIVAAIDAHELDNREAIRRYLAV